MFSIDSTLSEMPSAIATQLHLLFQKNEKGNNTKLIGVVFNKLYPLSIDKLAATYESILKELQEIDEMLPKDALARKQNWLENCALQMLFDLKVIEKMYTNYISGKFKNISEKVKSAIDPINAELLLPFLERQVLKYIQESHLLSPITNNSANKISEKMKEEDFNTTDSLFAYKFGENSDTEKTSCPKFAVLPLAITHHSMMSKDVKNDPLSESTETNAGFRTTSDVLEQSNQGFGKYFGFLS